MKGAGLPPHPVPAAGVGRGPRGGGPRDERDLSGVGQGMLAPRTAAFVHSGRSMPILQIRFRSLCLLLALCVPVAGARAQADAPPALRATAGAESLEVIDGPDTFKQHDLETPLPTRLTLGYGGRSWNLKLLGSGLRKKMVFKVYVAVLYADSAAVLGDDPAQAVCQQDIARRMVIVVKRDLDASRIADAIARGFIENVWKAPPDSLLAEELERYIAFFGGELKEGQRLDVTYLPGHGMFTSVSGEPRPLVTEPRLAHGIWSIWLGKTPISEDLRARLVERVAVDSGSR